MTDRRALWLQNIATDEFSASPEYCRLLRIPIDASCQDGMLNVDKKFLPRPHPGDAHRFNEATLRTLRGTYVKPFEGRLICHDNTEQNVIVVATRIMLGTDAVVGVRGWLAPTPQSSRLQHVGIVAHDPGARLGMSLLLNQMPLVGCIAECAPGGPVFRCGGHGAIPWELLDVVVIDSFGQPDACVALLQSIRARVPGCHIVLLADPNDGETARKLLLSRPDSLVHPGDIAHGLPNAIEDLMQNVRHFAGNHLADAAERTSQLTESEREVLAAIATGMSNKEISTTFYMSLPTVKRHIQRIYDKLGAKDRAHATAIAFRMGLI